MERLYKRENQDSKTISALFLARQWLISGLNTSCYGKNNRAAHDF
jgi:hypothetical protein